jgi:SH3-like domain-containing protein
MSKIATGVRAALVAACRIAVPGVAAAMLIAGVATAEQKRGQVTNLPIPRYVSMKATEANVRRGPSLAHRIDWVYRRKDLPLEIVAEFGHWRQVRDIDGAGGWVHYSLLSGVRTVMVDAPTTHMMTKPDRQSGVAAIVEKGVVARLDECTVEWCRIRKDGHRGWVQKTALWGVQADELIE